MTRYPKLQNQEINLYHEGCVVHFSLFPPSYLTRAYTLNFRLYTNNPQVLISAPHVSPEGPNLYLQMLA